jgi:riboflavin kinase/FMN adenylyltransferase
MPSGSGGSPERNLTVQQVDQLSRIPELVGDRPVAVTFGVFDGIHLGHQDLISRVVAWAREHDGLAAMLTFAQHPLRLLAPVYTPLVLTSRARRAVLLEKLGLDVLAAVDFDHTFAGQSPEAFVRDALIGQFRASIVFLGFNNRFGKDGAGDTALLRRLGEQMGFEVAIVPPRRWRGSVVSSTRVRQLLLDGRIRKANALLGRAYAFEGEVVRGDGRGQTLGFPTANLDIPQDLLLPSGGVYAVRVHHGGAVHGGMMNIGIRPTFEGEDLHVEVHLFNFGEELHGKTLDVEVLERMRDEQRFSSVEDLVAQLERDRADAQAILAREG